MIVVTILGSLAAIVIPEFSGHIQKAKESAAKDNLRILRQAIERYAQDHN
ncbi:MAG: type IV pilin protein, partial [Planctomycetota bacterium]